jgi:hypothetical protein
MISTTIATCRRQQIATQFTGGIAIAFLAIAAIFVAPTVLRAEPLPGAVFTTTIGCPGVDQNIYGSKGDVYINGGPAHPGAAGLPDGSYCVQVTSPDGTVLGVSAPGAVTVSGGEFASCYQLSAILNTATSGFTSPGYDDTNNPGGEYKVWISTDCTFTNSSTKTDNFKVKAGGGVPGGQASICVKKFYDANFNGVQDDGEPNLAGWEYCVVGNTDFSALRFTFDPPRCLVVDPDDYCVTEGTPTEGNWVHTTDTQFCFHLAADGEQDVTFGNVCLGQGGGLTLGFWSNKNGQKLETQTDFAGLTALCLRNANGGSVDFTGTLTANKTALNTFLLGATATNMANMLSAQLAAMYLNVAHHTVNPAFGVDGNAFVYEACLKDNGFPTGFVTINDLMAAANTELCAHPLTKDGSPYRAYQECLKDALDDANNNKNFVESSPCPYSFDTSDSCPFTNP